MENYNILHYTVGSNKNRGGGMTKYIDDLISFQKIKNNIFVLYTGQMKVFNKNVKIKKEKDKNNVKVYSIINPLPLPMLFGLQNEDYIYKKTNINIWKKFLSDNKIQIIHMHTLMGIYEEFIDAAKELLIPILFTTHDYFGICPKQTLLYNGKLCDKWISCENCQVCNALAMSNFKLYLIHTKLFTYLRNTRLFKILKSKEKGKIDLLNDKKNIKDKYDVNYYLKLKEKMIKMYKKITYFHFNSSITCNFFYKAIPGLKGEVLNISHKNIVDNRKIKEFNSKKLRVTYLGPCTSYKGFDDIILIFDEIYKTERNIILNLYSYTEIKRPYIVKHNNGYNYEDLEIIFDGTDILLAPSKCPETFGFTVAEAISYGVPVIVSNMIGAKDIVNNEKTGYVINNSEIIDKLRLIINNKNILRKMNKNIYSSKFITFEKHCEDLELIYRKILKK